MLIVAEPGSASPAPLDLTDHRAIDLTPVFAAGGLLDLVAEPGRVAAARWFHRMLDMRTGGWGHTTNGCSSPPLGYRALLDHTATVLASRRTTLEQRRTAARELLHRLHDRGWGSPGWCTSIPPNQIDELRTILPAAVVHRVPPSADDHAP